MRRFGVRAEQRTHAGRHRSTLTLGQHLPRQQRYEQGCE